MEMENQLSQMYSQLKNKRKKLRKLKIAYFGIIYKDILEHKSVREIHRDLYNKTLNTKVINNNLLVMMYKLARKAKKLDKGRENYYQPVNLTPTGLETKNNVDSYNIKGGGLTTLALGLLNVLNNDGANKLINIELMKEQSKEKEQIINNTIDTNRDKKIYFYVASRHKDCAKDHLPYQGKLYYDVEAFKSGSDEVKNYINSHNLLSLQAVMNKPIWFITRPYCRHFFRSVQTWRVLKGKYRVPTRTTGDYQLQTQKGATLEYYKDRLAYLEELYSIHPIQKLKDEILKTKMLIAKWEKKL